MIPARKLPLKEGKVIHLYVWYEYSGYYAAHFSVDKLPLVADSEFLAPGSFYGPFKSRKEAETRGILALKQLAISAGISIGSAA